MSARTLLAASVVAAFASSALAFDAYTDFAAWEAVAGPSTLDDLTSYGTVALGLGDNTFFDGYTVTLTGSAGAAASINAASNLVFTLGAELESITFTFDEQVNGFGATWLNSFVSNGLTVTINGESFNIEDSIFEANFDFVGFANGGPFSNATVTVTNPGQGTEFAAISEVYYSVVPAPASAAGLGIAGLVALRRRR